MHLCGRWNDENKNTMASLDSIIRLYTQEQKKDQKIPNLRAECEFYKNLTSIQETIELAGLAKNSKKQRHTHQRRLKKIVLEEFKDKLMTFSQKLLDCNNFDEIYQIVSVCKIKGIGDLAVYDCALRISVFLEKEPQKVYLHAGTTIGVIKLGINIANRSYLDISEFPESLQKLTAKEIEDLLCIHKYEF